MDLSFSPTSSVDFNLSFKWLGRPPGTPLSLWPTSSLRFVCSLNDQGETPGTPLPFYPTLHCWLHMFFKEGETPWDPPPLLPDVFTAGFSMVSNALLHRKEIRDSILWCDTQLQACRTPSTSVSSSAVFSKWVTSASSSDILLLESPSATAHYWHWTLA
jgi:hypothetical protein